METIITATWVAASALHKARLNSRLKKYLGTLRRHDPIVSSQLKPGHFNLSTVAEMSDEEIQDMYASRTQIWILEMTVGEAPQQAEDSLDLSFEAVKKAQERTSIFMKYPETELANNTEAGRIEVGTGLMWRIEGKRLLSGEEIMATAQYQQHIETWNASQGVFGIVTVQSLAQNRERAMLCLFKRESKQAFLRFSTVLSSGNRKNGYHLSIFDLDSSISLVVFSAHSRLYFWLIRGRHTSGFAKVPITKTQELQKGPLLGTAAVVRDGKLAVVCRYDLPLASRPMHITRSAGGVECKHI